MLGKTEGCTKGGGPSVKWIDSIKEAIGMSQQELSWPAKDRTWWTSLVHRVTGSRS